MRPLPRLEYEPRSGAILGYFILAASLNSLIDVLTNSVSVDMHLASARQEVKGKSLLPLYGQLPDSILV